MIAKPSRRGFLVIDAFSRIIRLGEGVLKSGRLSEAAMSRTIDALKVCADKMRRRGVTRSRAIATEACRIAANSEAFIARAKAETGLAIEIVTQETEAKLAVSGCASLIDRNADFTLVFDIGGGSSELIWLDLSRLGRPWRRTLHDRIDVQSCIAAWTSLPIGVVNLAERHGGRDVTPASYEAMVAEVMAGMGEFESKHRFGAEDWRATARIFSAPRAPSPPSRGFTSSFRSTSGRAWMEAGSAPATCARVGRSHRHELCRARGAALYRA